MSQADRDQLTNDLSLAYDLIVAQTKPNAPDPQPDQVQRVTDAAFRIVSRVFTDLNRMADAMERQAEALEGIRKRTPNGPQ